MLDGPAATPGRDRQAGAHLPHRLPRDADLGVLATIAEATNSAVVQRQRPEDDQQGLHRRGEQLLGPCGSASAIGSSPRRWPGPSPRRRPSSLTGAAAAVVGVLAFGPIGARWPGCSAYAARVGARHPPDATGARSIDPFAVNEPWRQFVSDAVQAAGRFDEAIAAWRKGPLRGPAGRDRRPPRHRRRGGLADRPAGHRSSSTPAARSNPDQTRWELAQVDAAGHDRGAGQHRRPDPRVAPGPARRRPSAWTR